VPPSLEDTLDRLQHGLGVQRPLRDRATRRMVARHKGQKHAEAQAEHAHDAADRFGREGHPARSGRKTKKATGFERKAQRECDRAIFWRGRARLLTQRIEGIETRIEDVRHEIAASKPKVNYADNTVVGGTFAERWVAANLAAVESCSNGRRRNAYSQAGIPDIEHPFGPGPAAGRRDDCSSYVTSIALATGADDPNGYDFSGLGYTGTLILAKGKWKQVDLDTMIRAGQGYIVYGDGTGFHTEAYCPSKTDKMRTVGHGDAAVNFGTVHLFGSGTTERYFVFEAA
jgi:hypothetical protein